MARTTRTFIALPVPSALGEKLTRLQGLLAPKVPAARWSSSPPFHMTLAFLGDVPDNDLNTVCKAVAEASLAFRPSSSGWSPWELSPTRRAPACSGPA